MRDGQKFGVEIAGRKLSDVTKRYKFNLVLRHLVVVNDHLMDYTKS